MNIYSLRAIQLLPGNVSLMSQKKLTSILNLDKKILLVVSTVLCALTTCFLFVRSRRSTCQSKKIQLIQSSKSNPSQDELQSSKQNQSTSAKTTVVNSPIITPTQATPSDAPNIEEFLSKNTPKETSKESSKESPKNQINSSDEAPKIEENLGNASKTDQLPPNHQSPENPSKELLILPNTSQSGDGPQHQPSSHTPNDSEVLVNPLPITPPVASETMVKATPTKTETEVAVDHPPTPKEIAPVIPPAKAEAEEAILDLMTLKPKHDLIIVSAQQLRIANKSLQKVHGIIVEEVVNISKNTGVYGLKNVIEKELKGESPDSKTYLAIKDRKIVGFLTGEIEKSNYVAEVVKKVDRFYVSHFRTIKELAFEKNPSEKIEETLMLEAMKKAKELGLTHFSYSHCFQATDDFGNKKMTPEHKFFTHLKVNVFKKCNAVCFEKDEVRDDSEGGTEKWKHNSYEIPNF